MRLKRYALSVIAPIILADSGLLPTHVNRISLLRDPEAPGEWIVVSERQMASEDAPAGYNSHRLRQCARDGGLSDLVSWLCTEEGFVPLQARDVANFLISQVAMIE